MKIALACVLLAAATWAEAGLKSAQSQVLRPSAGAEGRLAKLADKYDYPLAWVRSLRSKGLGWGELGRTLSAARKAGRKPQEVAALRRGGLGWRAVHRRLAAEGDLRDAVKEKNSVNGGPPRP